MFLIQDSIESRFAGLLTDGSTSEGISQFFTSTGAPPVHSAPTVSSFTTHAMKPTALAAQNKANASRTSPIREIAPAPAPAPAPVQASNPTIQDNLLAPVIPTATTTTNSIPKIVVPEKTTTAPVAAPFTAAQPKKHIGYSTIVEKGSLGIGLDLSKMKDGRAAVARFKQFPEGNPNPAALAVPKIMAGDIIAAVNGKACNSFAEAVAAIRSADAGSLELTFLREATTEVNNSNDID